MGLLLLRLLGQRVPRPAVDGVVDVQLPAVERAEEGFPVRCGGRGGALLELCVELGLLGVGYGGGVVVLVVMGGVHVVLVAHLRRGRGLWGVEVDVDVEVVEGLFCVGVGRGREAGQHRGLRGLRLAEGEAVVALGEGKGRGPGAVEGAPGARGELVGAGLLLLVVLGARGELVGAGLL